MGLRRPWNETRLDGCKDVGGPVGLKNTPILRSRRSKCIKDIRTARDEYDGDLGPKRTHMQSNIDAAEAPGHVNISQKQIKAALLLKKA